MGKSPCCDGEEVKKGPWSQEEDEKLKAHIEKHGQGNWRSLPKKAGLNRCGKSCRLRWTNYLRPDIKRGKFSDEEERLILHLHSILGNKWSAIATRLPGRTDNEIKNYWNTHIRKKLLRMGIHPVTHRRCTDLDVLEQFPNLLAAAAASINLGNISNPFATGLKLSADVTQLVTRIQLQQNLLQSIKPNLFNSDMAAISSLMGYDSLQNNQFGNYHANMGVNITGTSDLSFLNSNTFDPNLRLPMQNQPCSFTTTSTDNDCSTPPLVQALPCNAANTRIDPSISSTTSAINSSSSAINSIASSPSEPWDVKHFFELDNENIGWKDILE